MIFKGRLFVIFQKLDLFSTQTLRQPQNINHMENLSHAIVCNGVKHPMSGPYMVFFWHFFPGHLHCSGTEECQTDHHCLCAAYQTYVRLSWWETPSSGPRLHLHLFHDLSALAIKVKTK